MSTSFSHKPVVTDGLIFAIDGNNRKSGFQSDTMSADFVEADSTYLTSTSADFDKGDEDFSWGGWVYLDASITGTNARYFFGMWGATADRSYALIWSGSLNQFGIGIATNGVGGNNFEFHTGTTATKGQWYFVVGVYDSVNNLLELSVNGNTESYSYTGGIYSPASTLVLGSHIAVPTTNGLTGKLDNMFFYDKALSQSEIDDLYNGGSGQAYENADKDQLVSWWPMNDPVGDRIDRIGANDLTDNGDVGFSTGKVQEPLSFDYVKDMSEGDIGLALNGVNLGNTSNTLNRYWTCDGVNDYIQFDVLQNVPKVTVNIQFECLNSTVSQVLIRQGGNTVSYDIRLRGSDNKIGFFVRNTVYCPTSNVIWTSTSFSDNTLIDLSMSWDWDTTTCQIFIDGIHQEDVDFSSQCPTFYFDPANNGPVTVLGRNGTNDSAYFNGNIHNLKVYNRVLSPAEVLQNYNANKYKST